MPERLHLVAYEKIGTEHPNVVNLGDYKDRFPVIDISIVYKHIELKRWHALGKALELFYKELDKIPNKDDLVITAFEK